jgi:hypothetical protein
MCALLTSKRLIFISEKLLTCSLILLKKQKRIFNLFMHKTEAWSGKPSQILNAGVLFSTILFVTIPLAYLRWKSIKGIKYSLVGDQIIIERNFMGFEKNSFSINDVQRITMHQPVFLKLFSLNNLLITLINGKSIVFAGIKNAEDFTTALNMSRANKQELAY